jgi:hypothetical protein
MVDALDPERTEIRVLNSLCRLRDATCSRLAREMGASPGGMQNTLRGCKRTTSGFG